MEQQRRAADDIMKLVAFYAVYNEADYLERSLRSIYEHVDSIVVIEGAWGETAASCGEPRSTDGTLEILRNFPDPGKKIIVHHLNEKDQIAQRSKVFDLLPHEDAWMLLIDGDEVYPWKSMGMIRRFVDCKLEEGDPKHLHAYAFGGVLRFRSLIFVNDFWHVSKVDYPRLFFLRNGKDHKFIEPNRISRSDSLGYWHPLDQDVEVIQGDGDKISEAAPGASIGAIKMLYDWPAVEFFHYSYVKPPKRFMEKKRERTKMHGQFAWELREDPETGEVLVQRDDAAIEEFHGEHPEVMRDHPMFAVRRHKKIPPPKIIAMVCHSGIGNLIHATPCLRAIRIANPGAHIYMLTWPRSSRILEGWDVIDVMVEHHPLHFLRSLGRKPDIVMLSPAGAIWDGKWDAIAGKVLRSKIQGPWLKHETEYMMDFAYELGYRGSAPKPEVHLFDSNKLWASEFLGKSGIDRFICVNASYLRTEHWHMKHLGNEKFAMLAKQIKSKFPNHKILFVGSKEDVEDAYDIWLTAKSNPRNEYLFNACGASNDIKDTAALIARSDLVVGNDGGLMHVAAALGIPTVTIFTFTNPVKNKPLGKKSFVVMKPCQDRLSCQHGNWQRCQEKGCLDVPLESVINAIDEVGL